MERGHVVGVAPCALLFAVCVALVACTLAWSARSRADEAQSPCKRLTDLSLEELMGIEIVSAGRKRQTVSEASAAVYVVTGEDIRRSGATSIPQALRLVPGLEVAQVDSGKWAISARGFSGIFSNKMLVLIDGRSVYTPLFAGVFWDAQEILLEDVDRIEVIRGPGATMWGANAVNGVVNIITKSSFETEGGYFSTAVGSNALGIASARYGGELSENTYFRVQGRYSSGEPVEFPGLPPADTIGFSSAFGGIRIDWLGEEGSELTLKSDWHRGHEGEAALFVSLDPPGAGIRSERQDFSGGYLQGRWRKSFSEGQELGLHLAFDTTDRRISDRFHESRHTVDVEFQ